MTSNSDADRYAKVQASFNDLIGSGRAQGRNWQRFAMVLAGLAVIEALIIGVLAKRQPQAAATTDKQVVVLDARGELLETQQSNAAEWSPSDEMRKEHLIHFIECERGLSTDMAVVEECDWYIVHHVLDSANTAARAYRRGLKDRIGHSNIGVQVLSAIKESDVRWRLTWRERSTDLKNGTVTDEKMTGSFDTMTKPLSLVPDTRRNSIGLYITWFDWGRETP